MKSGDGRAATWCAGCDRLQIEMKLLWLREPLLSVLFENDDIVAIDKPYGFDTHTNESKTGNEDFVQPGLIELFEKQMRRPLHIVHRLDRTTTGVLVFAKTLDAAKIYQGYFRARETTKTYVFVTSARSAVDHVECQQPIVRNGDELAAETAFRLDVRAAGFERWTARPKTGRNHQIRIHGATVGLPLLGDEKYGGAKFPFICLHARRIEFPNGVSIEAALPAPIENLEVLKDPRLAEALMQIDRRRRLFSIGASPASCVRLVHRTSGDFTLDQFSSVLVLSWYGDRWTDADRARAMNLSTALAKPMLVRLMSKDAKGAHETMGDVPPSWIATEGDLKYEVRNEAGQSVGLFLDQRLQRGWVRENARDKTVLNLFSYTGAFSVAAAQGGAAEVTSVDSSKAMLNWSRRGFEINGLDSARAKFFNRDAVSFLEQSAAKGHLYDLVVCDPPSFSRGENGVFKLEQRLDELVMNCLKITRGQLLFSLNSDTIFAGDVRASIEKAAAVLSRARGAAPGHSFEIDAIQPSLDFETPDETPNLKSFLVTCI